MPLERLIARMARLPVLAWGERRVAALPPYAALAVFMLPWLLLLPLKLLALWLVGDGQLVLGVIAILLAKIGGTAVLARLFTLTKPALLHLRWFASLYGRWSVWKAGLLIWVRTSQVWHWGRLVKDNLLRRWGHWRQLVRA